VHLIGRVGVSLGTAVLLGFSKGTLMEVPKTAHFLLGAKCVNDCAFCSQARSSRSLPNQLSRVVWPDYSWRQLEGPLEAALRDGVFRRVCAQTVDSPQGMQIALDFIRRVRNMCPGVPISACASPYSLSRVRAFFEAGATNVGLPIDAVTPGAYARVKKGSIDLAWRVLYKASERWPGRISTHFIVGLGETEEEMVRALARAKEKGIVAGMFSFTPVRGTEMETVPPPEVSHYRRVQLAAYFLRRGGDVEAIEFRAGKICRIAVEDPVVQEEIQQGRPFMTSGCPDCNRPYYNERPGQVMMNFPRELGPAEARESLLASGLLSDGYRLTWDGGQSR
jgi:biotin synthase-related radical SAM superfamily protein